jgi:hypothetical protein
MSTQADTGAPVGEALREERMSREIGGLLYFALIGRRRLVLAPEEQFAMRHRNGAG